MTAKFHDPNNNNSMEFGNAGDNEPDEIVITIDHNDHEADYLYFSITKDEAKELVAYLKKEFKI